MSEINYEGIGKAADHIETYGLWKREPFPPKATDFTTSPACMIAALGFYEAANYATVKHIREVLGLRALSEWNDRPETTQEDVVATLRRAAHAPDVST